MCNKVNKVQKTNKHITHFDTQTIMTDSRKQKYFQTKRINQIFINKNISIMIFMFESYRYPKKFMRKTKYFGKSIYYLHI